MCLAVPPLFKRGGLGGRFEMVGNTHPKSLSPLLQGEVCNLRVRTVSKLNYLTV